MGRTVDIDVLLGFIEEAHGYMPGIRQGIERLPLTEDNRELVEDARRFVHIIKGASSMVGFAGLSHITYYMEEVLEDLLEEELPYSEAIAPFLLKTLDYVEQYLMGDMLEDQVDETPMLTDVTRAYRRLRGLPVAEDETAVAAVLAEVERAALEAEMELANELLESGEEDEDIAAFYMDEDLLPELLEAFAPEAEDHLRTISTQLTLLDKEPQDKEVLRVIRRTVHTLKGAAATVGLQAVADLSHRMEDLLDLVDDDSVTMTRGLMQLLFASSDMLEDMVAGQVDEAALAGLMTQYKQQMSGEAESIPTLEPLKIADLLGPEMVFDLGSQRATKPQTAPAAKKPQTAVNPDEVIRVPLERLNELVRLASELIITRTTFEQRLGDLNRLTNELQPSIDRLRRLSTRLETQYEVAALASTPLNVPPTNRVEENGRSADSSNGFVYEFDELEFDRYTEFHLLSRELAETTSDIRLVGNELNHLIGDFEGVIENQGRISSELQDKLMRTRMLPFATLTTRLQRVVRVVAQKQGKQVDLVIEGEEVELDKKVLDDIADPLLHVLRNAVDHGIEPAELRQVLGKPARGQIQLRTFYQGNQVVIQVQDDG
ncbi:MAG: Hpt domain-containing protein, partial [Anaerolineales bacterium]|nr:Hpt domain-containing protein [Anaerolineales bacterium]